MMDCYNHGYTKALLDVQEWFSSHSGDMKTYRLFNEKGVINVLDVLVKNREELRETGTIKMILEKKTKKLRSERDYIQCKRELQRNEQRQQDAEAGEDCGECVL